MEQRITKDILKTILQTDDVTTLGADELIKLVEEEKGLEAFLPDGACQVDPRNGDRVLFNTARARRPHDNRAEEKSAAAQRPCVVCQGKTTGVVDVVELSEGFSFINKNLFPMLYPVSKDEQAVNREGISAPASAAAEKALGVHLLQWTSCAHEHDWYNMPIDDLALVMQRLGRLEEKLLSSGGDFMPDNQEWGDKPGRRGYVCIIKNWGAPVGGSLAHGHQQIALSRNLPRGFLDNYRFEQREGVKFSEYMLKNNPRELELRDYGEAVLAVPYFMKRPCAVMLFMKDSSKRYIHELTASEQRAAAQGWHDATALFHNLMPRMGRETAYNVMTYNGPGAGLYFEFIPFTQETGGYEQLGLYVCQGNPFDTARQLRELL